MCNRNAKSEGILVKLRALVSEYIFEKLPNFMKKILYILFDSGVIDLQILMTKHLCFQYSTNS